MKIENLMEKDKVLDDDYLIVNGTDGTKKAKKSNFLSELNSRFHSINSGNNVEFTDNQAKYTGISATIPANSYYAITGKAAWNATRAIWVGLASDPALVNKQFTEGTATKSIASCSMCGYTDEEMNIYLWAEYSGAGNNFCEINGFYITAEP